MYKGFPYFFWLVIVLSFASCNKKHNITIQAQDYITGDGSAYTHMPFTVVQSRTGTFEDKFKTVYEGTLDQNGFASFDLKMNKDWNYILNVTEPDDICEGGVFAYYLDNETDNLVTFKYAKCAYLKFILNNTNCFNDSDAITYTRTWVTNNEIHGTNTYTGCDYYEGTYFEIPGGEYLYEWSVTKNSITTYHLDSLNLNPGDSIVFQIDY